MTRLLNSIRALFTLPAQTPARPNEASPYEIKAQTEWIDSTLGVVAVIGTVYAVGGLAVWALDLLLAEGAVMSTYALAWIGAIILAGIPIAAVMEQNVWTLGELWAQVWHWVKRGVK